MEIGKVISTFSATKSDKGLPRPKKDKLNLINDFGIENDKFAGKDLDKTVMIVGTFTYDMAKNENINLKFGSLGENILFDFNPHNYKVGTQFKIGTAIIEITENCTICNHLSKFDDDLPILIKDCRGIYCKIINSGVVKDNDTILLYKKG